MTTPSTRLHVATDLAGELAVGSVPSQAHYVKAVLRLAPVDTVALFNGRDGEWLGRIDGIGKGWCSVTLHEQRRPQAREGDLWLAFAPIKRARIDFLVEKATELGVSELRPVYTERTIVERVNLDRLRANAVEAAEQTERLTVPTLREPEPLARLLARWPAERRLLLCDESGAAPPIAQSLRGKRRAAGRRGGEHEKFVFRRKDRKPVRYDGPDGIRALLQGLSRFGWQPVLDAGNLIGLSNAKGGAISLEPGGQFELSGAPVESLHQTCGEVHEHLRQVLTVAGELGLRLLAMGFPPTARREDVPWMPKGRYAVMRRYMPKKGKLGLDMMLRTCTVQVNLDFESEADIVRKFRTGLALQPVAAALFANSPFVEGKPNGYLSYRSHVWTDVDPDRTGMLPFVFEDGFGFERYVDYMLDGPMYFVYRDGRYIDG